MKVPLVDLAAQYLDLKGPIDQAIDSVLESGAFILGPNVAAFEESMASYLGTKHAVGVASCTDALVLVLHAYGIGERDEVIVPAYTFFATAEAVTRVGATPVFADVDRDTFCLDPSRLEESVTPRTRAVIPVHLYGHPAHMRPILDFAARRELLVVEDNAQALGARYEGSKTGSIGHAACLSFFPSKNLGAYGDGGMVATNDGALAEHVRKLRTHGWARKYFPELPGFNSRLDELQAAVLRVKLRHLDDWNERRRVIADRYRALLGHPDVSLPTEAPHARHVYHLFVIRVADPEGVAAHLRSRDVASSRYYPLPLHLVEAYRDLGHRPGSFPEAEAAARQTLAIPLYPEMSEDQIASVADAVAEALAPEATREPSAPRPG